MRIIMKEPHQAINPIIPKNAPMAPPIIMGIASDPLRDDDRKIAKMSVPDKVQNGVFQKKRLIKKAYSFTIPARLKGGRDRWS
ncbi:MAG TPA: hypothetical protein PK836_05300 [Syntrophales bacterium]|nr:hypothetical protein [Syntrophales bacterium]HPC01086.1 hypothetical protein [Syntrophales bacterium]